MRGKIKGTYVLLLRLSRPTRAVIGAAGERELDVGHYCYVGSAFGSRTNVENRVQRYLLLKSRDVPLRWHIDYILKNECVDIEAVYVLRDDRKECDTAHRISEIATPISGIGCSDCRCETHFFRVKGGKLEGVLSEMGFFNLKLSDLPRG